MDWESLSLRLAFAAMTAVAIVFLVAPSLIVILTSLTPHGRSSSMMASRCAGISRCSMPIRYSGRRGRA
jgi:hypothetical protein